MFSKRTLRSALGGSGVALLAAAAAVVSLTIPSAHAAGTPLRDLAAAKGVYMGTALMQNELTGTSGSIAAALGSSAINGWTVKWTQSSGTQTVTQAWNATVAKSGTGYTATNLSYNASIPAGGSTSFGFNADWSGANPAPTGFTLNGSACSVR